MEKEKEYVDELPDEPDMLAQYLLENPHVSIVSIIDTAKTCPVGVKIVVDEKKSCKLITTTPFQTAEIVFQNKAWIDTDETKVFIMKIGDFYKRLTHEDHIIHRQDYYEMIGFDSFMNHSCSPNTRQYYISKDEYIVVAREDIEAGTELTCDYRLLHNEFLGLKSIDNISFDCCCGSHHCVGRLVY